MTLTVLLVGGEQWGETKMFRSRGWKVVRHPDEADFLCFLGGSDIDPKFYGQTRLPCTHTSPKRDVYEKAVWDAFPDKMKLGICRGGQLLNALSGGDMYQDVDNHNSGPHEAIDEDTGEVFLVSSVHHQMMIPSADAKILATASESTHREKAARLEVMASGKFFSDDIEALWYDKTKSFCYQPHPEWGPDSCTDYFFKKINSLFEIRS